MYCIENLCYFTAIMDLTLSSLMPEFLFSHAILLSIAIIFVPIIVVHVTRFRYLWLVKKVPGYKDWPVVGDSLHFKRDPAGSIRCDYSVGYPVPHRVAV